MNTLQSPPWQFTLLEAWSDGSDGIPVGFQHTKLHLPPIKTNSSPKTHTASPSRVKLGACSSSQAAASLRASSSHRPCAAADAHVPHLQPDTGIAAAESVSTAASLPASLLLCIKPRREHATFSETLKSCFFNLHDNVYWTHNSSSHKRFTQRWQQQGIPCSFVSSRAGWHSKRRSQRPRKSATYQKKMANCEKPVWRG